MSSRLISFLSLLIEHLVGRDHVFLLSLSVGPSGALHLKEAFLLSLPPSPSLRPSVLHPSHACTHSSIYLSASTLEHPPVHSSLCLFIHPSTYPSLHSFTYPSIYPPTPIHPFPLPFIHPSTHPSHHKDSEHRDDQFLYELVVNGELWNVLEKSSHLPNGHHILEKLPRQECVKSPEANTILVSQALFRD